MAKLSNDYINWTLTLNASQTQKEIHNLTESSIELEKSNKVLRERMGQLVQAGQKNSKEYRELNKAIKENNRIVSENKAKVSQLKSQLDLSAMSANQLARRAPRSCSSSLMMSARPIAGLLKGKKGGGRR